MLATRFFRVCGQIFSHILLSAFSSCPRLLGDLSCPAFASKSPTELFDVIQVYLAKEKLGSQPGLRSRRISGDSDSESYLKISTPTPAPTPLRLHLNKSYSMGLKIAIWFNHFLDFPFWLHPNGWCGNTAPVRANCGCKRPKLSLIPLNMGGMAVFELIAIDAQRSRWL